MEVQCTPLNWDFFHDDNKGIITMDQEELYWCNSEMITKKEDEVSSLMETLSQALRERDEAESKCQTLMSDILTLQQQQQQQDQPKSPEIYSSASLPEKGKLLEAVMEAGPLLQNLLLAGPLPQWQNPPPRLDAAEIPPVSVSLAPAMFSSRKIVSCSGRKRSFEHFDDQSFELPYLTCYQSPIAPANIMSKCQKVIE